MDCDAILKQGVFDTMITNTGRSVSENLFAWLTQASYRQYQELTNAGLKLGLPVKGVPLEIGANYAEGEFEQWKQDVANGNGRTFTEAEAMQIVQSSASPVIANAWVACIKASAGQGQSGLMASLDVSPDPSILTFTARYIPDSIDDHPPMIQDFQVVGATTGDPLIAGQEIPFGGVGVLMLRQGNSTVAVNLDTDKGEKTFTAPAIPDQTDPRDIKLEVFQQARVGGDDVFSMRLIGPDQALDTIRAVNYTLFVHRQMFNLASKPLETREVFRWQEPTFVGSSSVLSSNDRATGFAAEFTENPDQSVDSRERNIDGMVTKQRWAKSTTTGIKATVSFADGKSWDYIWAPWNE